MPLLSALQFCLRYNKKRYAYILTDDLGEARAEFSYSFDILCMYYIENSAQCRKSSSQLSRSNNK